MTLLPVYLHVQPGSTLPDLLRPYPFRAIVVIDSLVTSEWQAKVSNWLIRSGCLYMLAWGTDCSSWDDSVDFANIEQFGFADIPEDRFVITTWHADERLNEVFDFCKRHAVHPAVKLHHTVLLHIADQGNEKAMVKAYAAA